MSVVYRFSWVPVVLIALALTVLVEHPPDFVLQILEKTSQIEYGVEDTTVWEVFFSVFGLIYAIIVGLLIVEAHRRQRDLSAVVQAELNALGDINDFLRYFNGRDTNKVKNVIESLKLYCDDVGNDTEPRKLNKFVTSVAVSDEEKDDVLHVRRRQHIRRIIKSISGLKVEDKNDGYALQAMMDRVSALTSFRAQKTEIARLGFPGVYYAILAVMTFFLIFGFIVMPVNDASLHYFIVFAIALATTILLTIVYDLDKPLDGFWSIRREVFDSIKITSRNINTHLQAVDQLADFKAAGDRTDARVATAPSGVTTASHRSMGDTSVASPASEELVVFLRERHTTAAGPGSS